MVIQVVASIFDNFRYYGSLSYLQKALQNNEVAFDDVVNNHAPGAFVFNKSRIYDFTRSAKPTIRDNMTTYLNQPNVLPDLEVGDHETLKKPFDCLFNYHWYKTSLKQDNSQQAESMKMLIFNDANGDMAKQYVAHVTFSCNSHRAVGQQKFSVNATLTCQRFTYFPSQ